MSLTGKLEDLPLLDIIQIVSFSQKTGYLTIQTVDGEGAIIFESGSIVAAFTSDAPPPKEPLEYAALKRRIEGALTRLTRLTEGQFNFSLAERTPGRIGDRDITPETLTPGINGQEVLLDLARELDEDRRDSQEALAAPFDDAQAPTPTEGGAAPSAAAAEEPTTPAEEPTQPEPPAEEKPPEAPPVLLVIDDEPAVLEVLGGEFTNAGYEISTAEGTNEGAKRAKELKDAGRRFVVITDLGMPTSNGTSFQGGFEVVKRLRKQQMRPPVLMMTDTVTQPIRARSKQMGISSLVYKPGLSKLDPTQYRADLIEFAGKVARRVLPRLIGELAGAAPARAKRRRSGQVDLASLLAQLRELRDPDDVGRISALLLEVAEEFFERAVLFVVRGEELRGVAGFGVTHDGTPIGDVARSFSVPLAERSIFADVIASRRTVAGPPPNDPVTARLRESLGPLKAKEVAALGLVAYREPLAFLYGDNPESGRALSGLEQLDIFVGQAAVALENLLLQRKLAAADRSA